MTESGTGQSQGEVTRVGRSGLVAAAARLVGGTSGNARQAGRAFLERASDHGIDLSCFWTISGGGRAESRVPTQAVLIVPQVGRTAMVFLSGPGPSRQCGDEATQTADRAALLRGAFEGCESLMGDDVHLLQALPSPDEPWAIDAFGRSGMTRLGNLAYLRRPLTMTFDAAGGVWPPGVRMRPIGVLGEAGEIAALTNALERTYIDTLDCPGLCSLRRTADVIESHKSAGDFTQAHWWLIEADGEPEGCVLLSPSFENKSLELVYMGLGPRLRGKGLATLSLRTALARAQRMPLDDVSCAVDLDNEPARAVYAKLGFAEFARRVAFVRPTAAGPTGGRLG